jgi:NADH-quinone oxidoreductase subunit C
MSEEIAASILKQKLPDSILAVNYFRGEETILVRREKIAEICLFLRDHPELRFNYLTEVCGVDFPEREERFEIVYHLYSLESYKRVRLKVLTDEEKPVPSVTSVWPTANWHEREVFDMFGVKFSGHPDLRRVLMPEDFEKHPLRKDFPLYEESDL